MQLKLIRKYKKDNYTIGKLYINNSYFCDTLEDKDRGLTSDMSVETINGIKIKGKTAIPIGKYEVTLDICSPKYSNISHWKSYNGGYMPRLIDVKGFTGILIHSGNTADDSDGCILVGKNTVVGKVLNSVETLKKLYDTLKVSSTKGEKIELEIV